MHEQAGFAAIALEPDTAGGLSPALDKTPTPADVAFLERGLYGFEEARLGSPGHEHFAIFLRDNKGRIQGGVDAHVMWRRLFVKTLWVDEGLRGRGHGRRLMEELEEEALRRRCRSLWLTALGPPACQFYLKGGFVIVGAIDGYVEGNSLYTMEKILTERS